MQERNFSTHLEQIDGDTYLKIVDFKMPLTGKTKSFDVKLPVNSAPLVFYTATTGMIETIGNMTGDDTACGYMYGNPKHIFRVRNPFSYKAGERVYITEHLQLDGKPEYIATKHRILQGQNNFVSIGHIKKNKKKVVRLVIDVVTGEHKWF